MLRRGLASVLALGLALCLHTTADAQICPEQYSQECCNAVCEFDSFCCEFEWDEACDTLTRGLEECGDPPPSNDTCETAIEVFDGIDVEGTNLGATLNGGTVLAECTTDTIFEYDVWYFIEVSETSILTVSTCDAAVFDTRIFLFTSCKSDDPVACNDDGAGCSAYTSTLAAAVQPGTFYIMVDGWGGAQGDFTLSISLLTGDPPENDDLADAIEVFEGSTPFTTVFASTDGSTFPGDECSGTSDFENDVWFTYTPTLDARMALSTSDAATEFDTQIELLDETGMSLACNDDDVGAGVGASTVRYDVVAGETYTVRVGGFGNTFGAGVLHIARPPDNDDCADAIALTADVAVTYESFAANDSPEEGIPDGEVCGNYGEPAIYGDVWYTFDVPAHGSYSVETCGRTDGINTRVAVYDGCGGTLLYCNDDLCDQESRVFLPDLVEGEMLTIRVGGSPTGYNATTRAYGLGGIVVASGADDPCAFPPSVFDFEGDMSATDGTATIGPVGGDDSWFEFATDSISGEDTGVMHVLGAHSNTQSLAVRYEICPNPSNSDWVNSFTMIWDVKVTANWIPLYNSNDGDPYNYNYSEIYITPEGQFWVYGLDYVTDPGTIQPDTWYRIAFVSDLDSGNAYIYIDGELAVTGAGLITLDSQFALYLDIAMILADSEGYTGEAWLSSYLIDDHAMTAEEIATLGGPTAGGISGPGGGGGCVGDLDGNDLVDGADLTMLLGNWGRGGVGDLDGSGSIDGADLTMLLGRWGPC